MAKIVMRDKSLSASAKGLYAYLAVFCDSKRECYPSRALIADELAVTKDTLGKMLRQLVDAGYLEIIHEKKDGKFFSNRYRLTDTPLPKFSDTEIQDTVFSDTEIQDTVFSDTEIQDINSTSFNNTSFNNASIQEREGTSSPVPSPAKKKQPNRFTPPTVEEVRAYCEERNNGINPERFVDYYSAQGWKLSNGQPMKDWQAAVRKWEGHDRADRSEGKASLSSANNPNKVKMPF